jgi:hypothetical protein
MNKLGQSSEQEGHIHSFLSEIKKKRRKKWKMKGNIIISVSGFFFFLFFLIKVYF